jgi:hypothetical protein
MNVFSGKRPPLEVFLFYVLMDFVHQGTSFRGLFFVRIAQWGQNEPEFVVRRTDVRYVRKRVIFHRRPVFRTYKSMN